MSAAKKKRVTKKRRVRLPYVKWEAEQDARRREEYAHEEGRALLQERRATWRWGFVGALLGGRDTDAALEAARAGLEAFDNEFDQVPF